MLTRARSSAFYSLAVVLLLGGLQLYAMAGQWRAGFRPFRVAPQRVPLSWDMFAVEIERCGLSWDPPTYWEGKLLHELRDLGALIEWDPIFNQKRDYIQAAGLACDERPPGSAWSQGTLTVHCFGAQAKETRDEFSCPEKP